MRKHYSILSLDKFGHQPQDNFQFVIASPAAFVVSTVSGGKVSTEGTPIVLECPPAIDLPSFLAFKEAKPIFKDLSL